jgi:hypothetical protein
LLRQTKADGKRYKFNYRKTRKIKNSVFVKAAKLHYFEGTNSIIAVTYKKKMVCLLKLLKITDANNITQNYITKFIAGVKCFMIPPGSRGLGPYSPYSLNYIFLNL